VEKTTIARSYATALFELAGRRGEVETISRAFASVNALLSTNRRVGEFLGSPKIELAAKKRVLRTTFESRVPLIFLNFLLVVLDQRRQRLLHDIAREYDLLVDQKLGRVNVNVTLAREPGPRDMEAITARLSALTGRAVVAHVHVEPAILGGIIVRYGDRLLDGSLRRQLVSLRGRLMEANIAVRNPGTLPG
jgi:F-type H+-transporting ATPase subunit delta